MNIKMRLAKLGVTVTQNVSIALLLGCFFLVSCQAEKSKLTTNWETKSVDKSSLLKVPVNRLGEGLVETIKNDYAISPLQTDYIELDLSAVYANKADDKLIVFFDVRHVDDIQVVYEIREDGYLLSKYIYSEWNN